jgi:16S rRNA (adenine1518-N6/adenine1519-N6)-dimethyltransferase
MSTRYIAKKRFGQNFLHDQYTINEIIKIIDPKQSDTIIEIGPGLGVLTKELVLKTGHLEAIEIDRDLINTLQLMLLYLIIVLIKL